MNAPCNLTSHTMADTQNPELESLTDAQLSEVFAVEVAGWVDVNTIHWQKPDVEKLPHWNRFAPLPLFAASADAVLPFLEKHSISVERVCYEEWSIVIDPSDAPDDGNDYTPDQYVLAGEFDRDWALPSSS